ncbi:tryptase-like isoform X5 [Corythoichthys intestinalis]|uniref:tryptase-like isoform X5 n=1 Tax=Corythoichthys intestinalis TaxID=161448 RepID=UPI0025A5179C|nr:tryptase-like isoform X5 [Corythoichthys intestinalis]
MFCSHSNEKLYEWPKDTRARKWTSFVRTKRMNFTPSSSSFLCCKHFEDACFLNRSAYDQGFAKNPDLMVVHLGRQRQSGPNPNELNFNVSMAIVHPEYDVDTVDNDMTLLLLSAPVNFNEFIKPVCLAAATSTFFAGTNSWVTGWGFIGEGIPLPPPGDLMEVKMPVVGNRKCFCQYCFINITENMICAGLTQGGRGGCPGDSGGPLMSKNGSVWVQSGVASFAFGCGQPRFPTVFARVSQYQDWIINHTGVENMPGFVTFTSPGTDSDLHESCAALPPIDNCPGGVEMFWKCFGDKRDDCNRAPPITL